MSLLKPKKQLSIIKSETGESNPVGNGYQHGTAEANDDTRIEYRCSACGDRELGGRFPFSLTLPNLWVNTKRKDSPEISPGITPGICLLRYPRVMHLTLNVLEG